MNSNPCEKCGKYLPKHSKVTNFQNGIKRSFTYRKNRRKHPKTGKMVCDSCYTEIEKE